MSIDQNPSPFSARQLLLLIIPLYCYFMLTAIHKNNSPYHISGVDPSYAYLLNSLNLASGFMKAGHWDHPGSTAQLTGALLLKINHIIYGEQDIITDVIKNPEMYFSKISHILIFILSFLLAYLGLLYYRKSGNLIEAVIIQLSPLVCHYGFYLSDRLIPEYFLICGLLTFIYLNFLFLHYVKAGKKKNTVETGIAISCGFLIATKFSVFPILLIPVLLYLNIRKILKFLLILVLSFGVLVFPIWTRFKNFYNFILSIIQHDGRYGQGNEQVINSDTFFDNIITLFTQNLTFTVFFIITLIVLGFINRKESKYAFRFVLASIIAVCIQVVIVGKHFGLHYFLPAEIIILPATYIAARRSSRISAIVSKYRLSAVMLGGVAVFVIYQNYSSCFFWYDLTNPKVKTMNFVDSYGVDARVEIKTVNNIGPEHALFWGGRYTREKEIQYRYAFEKEYPSTYFFDNNLGTVQGWLNDLIPTEIIRKHGKLLFIESNNIDKAISKFLKYNTAKIDTTVVYYNPQTTEKVYLIETRETNRIEYPYRITCDMSLKDETGNYFMSIDSTVYFAAGSTQNIEVYKSKGESILLDTKDQYAFNAEIPVKQGGNYRMEIWRYSPKDHGALVATNRNVPGFYASSVYPAVKEQYWEKMQVCFSVPFDYPDTTVSVYLWNTGKEPVYFDDFEFVEIP